MSVENTKPSPVRKVTVEIISAPTLDPLARSATILTSATRTTASDYDRKVKAAQEALAPTIADAAAILRDVETIWKQRGESLEKFSRLDWSALRLRGVNVDLLNRVSRLVSDTLATFSSARYELQAIPGRVANLGRHAGLGGHEDDDLELTNWPPMPFLPTGGMAEKEPTRIRADVERQRKTADSIREQLLTLEYVVGQIEEKLKALKASGAPNGVAVSIERPDDFRPQPKQTRADSEFDPLSYGRS